MALDIYSISFSHQYHTNRRSDIFLSDKSVNESVIVLLAVNNK